jgi:hypothetical protein
MATIDELESELGSYIYEIGKAQSDENRVELEQLYEDRIQEILSQLEVSNNG